MRTWLTMAAIALPAFAAMAFEFRPLDCRELSAGAVPDPLSRDGLAGVDCALPDGTGSVMIVSDENISWPVIVRSGRSISFEDYLLGNAGLLGPGLAYFDPEPGAVLFDDTPPGRVLIRFQSSDPVTLERSVRWLV